MTSKFSEHKRKTIERLYLKEDKSLKEVMEIMEEEHNFHPTKGQYETLLRNWGFRKNLTGDEWKGVERKLQTRKQLGKQSQVYLNNRLIPEKRLERQIQRYGYRSLASTQDQDSPVPDMVSIRSPSPIPIQGLENSQDIPPPNQSPSPVHTPGFDVIQTTPTHSRDISFGHITRLDALQNIPFLRFEEDVFDPLRLVSLPTSQLADFMGTSLRARDSRYPAGGDEFLLCEDRLDLRQENTPLQHSNLDLSMVMQALVQGHAAAISNIDETSDIIQMIAPRLQINILEKHEGGFLDDLWRQQSISFGDIRLHIIKFGLYFISNNLFTASEMVHFLNWIISNGPRMISILRELLSEAMPTIEAFVHSIFQSIVPAKSRRRAKALLASGAYSHAELTPPEFEFYWPLENGYVDLVKVLLEAGDRFNIQKFATSDYTARDFFEQIFSCHDTIVFPGRIKPVEPCLDLRDLVNSSVLDVDYGDSHVTLCNKAHIPRTDELFLTSGANVDAFNLSVAIEEGKSLEIIRTMIRAGAEVNKIEKANDSSALMSVVMINKIEKANDSSALMSAVMINSLEIVQELLLWGAKVDSAENPFTELQRAASKGFIQIVQSLLKAGANINKKGPNGVTALHEAAECNHQDIVHLLLDHDARLGSTRHYYPRSELLAAVENGNIFMVRDLLDAGADVNAEAFGDYGSSALETALAKKGDSVDGDYAKITYVLVEYGADITLAVNNDHREHELLQAIQRDDVRTCRFLLSIGMAANTESLRSALCAAIRYKKRRLVELLVKAGADVNVRDLDNITPLQYSIKTGCIDTVKLLLCAGANPNAPCAIKKRRKYRLLGMWSNTNRGLNINEWPSNLDIAIDMGVVAIVELLLQAGAEVNTAGQMVTPLHRAASLEDKPSACRIIKLLLSKDPFINIPPANEGGRTILQTAIESSKTLDDCSVAEILVEAGENVNARAAYEDGRTALQIAVGKRNSQIVQFLISKGADINAPAGWVRGKTALQVAVEKSKETKDLVMVDYLLENGADINGLPGYNFGRSALQMATSTENIFPKLIDRLLEAGAEINLPAGTVMGLTALQGAAIQGHAKLVLRLLTSGAHVDAPGARSHGRTALEGAAEHGRLDTVQILLNAGAESHLPPKRRYKTAINLAEKTHHFTVAKLLKER